MRLDIHIHWPELERALIENHRELLAALKDMEKRIMASLTDLQAAVAAEDTVIDSAIALIVGLADQIKNLQPTQEAIDALAADVTARADALSKAVTDNTPAA